MEDDYFTRGAIGHFYLLNSIPVLSISLGFRREQEKFHMCSNNLVNLFAKISAV